MSRTCLWGWSLIVIDSSTRRVLNERKKKERRGDSEQRKAKMSTGLPSLWASVPTAPTVFPSSGLSQQSPAHSLRPQLSGQPLSAALLKGQAGRMNCSVFCDSLCSIHSLLQPLTHLLICPLGSAGLFSSWQSTVLEPKRLLN